MATTPTPAPDQQGASAAPPAGGAPSSSPDQQGASTGAPANQLQMLLAKWYQTAQQMAASDPRLASGANKVAQGIQEMQTALVSPPQPTPTTQQPMY